jgi:hypothetical protein
MFISRRWITGVLAFVMAAGTCLCEDPAPVKFYKLEFVVKEVGGAKVLNTRAYTAVVSTGNRSEIRAGSKIPYASSTTQYQQADVGVSIDAWAIREVQDRLSFNIVVDISSVAEGGSEMRPTIRQNRWSSTLIVPLKKPTLLFSSDNMDAKTEMQIEVTATPIPLP